MAKKVDQCLRVVKNNFFLKYHFESKEVGMKGVGAIELVWEEPLPDGSVADSRHHVIRLSTRDYDGETHLRVETLVDHETVDIVETRVETSWPVTTVQVVEFHVPRSS